MCALSRLHVWGRGASGCGMRRAVQDREGVRESREGGRCEQPAPRVLASASEKQALKTRDFTEEGEEGEKKKEVLNSSAVFS